MFNSLLTANGIPLDDVRLLRHMDKRAEKGRTPYELWRNNRPAFEDYQSTQNPDNQDKLDAPFWASFVGTPSGDTLFVGLYRVKYLGRNTEDRQLPHMEGIDLAGTCDTYAIEPVPEFRDLDGKLSIDWGAGKRAWIQYASNQDKPITELRKEFKEPEFPGFLNFIKQLSELDSLPQSWITTLQSSRGVYLLTCPTTKEQYVGSATGGEAFWHRWQDYVRTGHGGNVALKSRDPSDYQVSILEVAGSAATTEDIIRMEQRWKGKLQSQEMGLNRN